MVSLAIVLLGNIYEYSLFFVFPLTVVYSAIVSMIFIYRIWAAIQDGHARATPEKAVGFLFIPFFNLYWVFQVFWGFAQDFNAYTLRHGMGMKYWVPENLYFAYATLILLAALFARYVSWFQYVMYLAFYFVGLVIVDKTCDAINNIVKYNNECDNGR